MRTRPSPKKIEGKAEKSPESTRGLSAAGAARRRYIFKGKDPFWPLDYVPPPPVEVKGSTDSGRRVVITVDWKKAKKALDANIGGGYTYGGKTYAIVGDQKVCAGMAVSVLWKDRVYTWKVNYVKMGKTTILDVTRQSTSAARKKKAGK